MPPEKLQERVEFRLDPHTKRLLQELARRRGQSLDETIRQLLREALGLRPEARRHARRDAARRLTRLGLRDLPPPEELEEEIHRAFSGAD